MCRSSCKSSQTISVGRNSPLPPAANSLPGAEGLDRHAVAQPHGVLAPDAADGDGLRIIGGDPRVLTQFGLDVLQMGDGLMLGVRNDP